MSKKDYTKNILSKYILQKVFSHLDLNVLYNIIKYNKSIQKRLNIDLKDSIFNYEYTIKTKTEIMKNIKKMQSKPKYWNLYYLSYASLFFLRYNYYFSEYINEKEMETKFLIKYKGFKINDYPLPSYFNLLNNSEKANLLKKHECYFKFSLNAKNIKLINLINELREKNNMSLLIYNKLENLNTFFQQKEPNFENYSFTYPLGIFKNEIVKDENEVIKILLKKELRYITILEKENREYIFLYTNKEEKTDIKINNEIKSKSKSKINNYEKFHLINNTKPKVKIQKLLKKITLTGKKNILNNIKFIIGNNDYGYQILNIFNDFLIGVLEGPPGTPYENGYFLFKILIPYEFPFQPIKFCFITPIFHPNISEGGFVRMDIFNAGWSASIFSFQKVIYSVQSFLDDPNPDYYINEIAAKIYKKDRNIYDETVRYYTSQFANYSKFLEDLNNLKKNFEYLRKRNKKKLFVTKPNLVMNIFIILLIYIFYYLY